MTINEQVILQSILAKIDRVERAILEQRVSSRHEIEKRAANYVATTYLK